MAPRHWVADRIRWVGFAFALLTAMAGIRALLAFLAHHTFRVFGWYRIAFGLAMAAVLVARG